MEWGIDRFFHQSAIEDRLFRRLHSGARPELFLYDVTSSYLEGQHKELGAFGYNRDGKRGEKQCFTEWMREFWSKRCWHVRQWLAIGQT